MKKAIVFGLILVVYYMILVFILGQQKLIFPTFTITTLFFAMFFKDKKNLVFLYLPLLLIFVGHLPFPNTTISTTIIYILFIPLTFHLGSKLKDKHWKYKLIYPLFMVLIGLYGFSNFRSFIKNYDARQKNTSPIIKLFSEDKVIKRLDTVKNKVIVLDFWTTSCGVCFKKFPKYETVFLEYQDNPMVELYAVNIPTKRDTVGRAKAMISRYNYKFPVLYANSDSLPKSLGFNRYPQLIILKDGNIRYNGLLNVDSDVFIHNLNNEIEFLLEEE